MAALICILLKMLKDARVASSVFLISTLQRYRNSKETLQGLQNKVIWNSAGLYPYFYRLSSCSDPTSKSSVYKKMLFAI